MRSRWTILGVLFVARAAMAFQFQSVASLAPQLEHSFDADLADIGLLIGLYFAPGPALAWPGGAIGRRFGGKATVLAGLLLMVAGELAMAASATWNVQIAGRLLAGTGGVLVNVLMTTMLADWFAGREIATAMAVFVNSWPVGIAMSLIVLPEVAAAHGVQAAALTVAGLIAFGMGLVAFLYCAPNALAMPEGERSRPGSAAIRAVVVSGLAWCFYNVGLAMVFSFGPSMLVTRGWSGAAAGSTISIVLWLAALSVPFGGWLADRCRRGMEFIAATCVAFALLEFVLSRTALVLPNVIAIGLVCGLPAGAILALPARALEPATRPIGMGIFYAVYYAGMLAAPAIGGKLSAMAGTASAALDFGAVALLLCPVILWQFKPPLASRGAAAQAARAAGSRPPA